eukprot:snap_masked-scaffold_54-processed-gene-0.5-mRNA-1 protein AED:1.00 eAED:1.00 QI:0/-1/0/0/-1/1/1/0/336
MKIWCEMNKRVKSFKVNLSFSPSNDTKEEESTLLTFNSTEASHHNIKLKRSKFQIESFITKSQFEKSLSSRQNLTVGNRGNSLLLDNQFSDSQFFLGVVLKTQTTVEALLELSIGQSQDCYQQYITMSKKLNTIHKLELESESVNIFFCFDLSFEIFYVDVVDHCRILNAIKPKQKVNSIGTLSKRYKRHLVRLNLSNLHFSSQKSLYAYIEVHFSYNSIRGLTSSNERSMTFHVTSGRTMFFETILVIPQESLEGVFEIECRLFSPSFSFGLFSPDSLHSAGVYTSHPVSSKKYLCLQDKIRLFAPAADGDEIRYSGKLDVHISWLTTHLISKFY